MWVEPQVYDRELFFANNSEGEILMGPDSLYLPQIVGSVEFF